MAIENSQLSAEEEDLIEGLIEQVEDLPENAPNRDQLLQYAQSIRTYQRMGMQEETDKYNENILDYASELQNFLENFQKPSEPVATTLPSFTEIKKFLNAAPSVQADEGQLEAVRKSLNDMPDFPAKIELGTALRALSAQADDDKFLAGLNQTDFALSETALKHKENALSLVAAAERHLVTATQVKQEPTEPPSTNAANSDGSPNTPQDVVKINDRKREDFNDFLSYIQEKQDVLALNATQQQELADITLYVQDKNLTDNQLERFISRVRPNFLRIGLAIDDNMNPIEVRTWVFKDLVQKPEYKNALNIYKKFTTILDDYKDDDRSAPSILRKIRADEFPDVSGDDFVKVENLAKANLRMGSMLNSHLDIYSESTRNQLLGWVAPRQEIDEIQRLSDIADSEEHNPKLNDDHKEAIYYNIWRRKENVILDKKEAREIIAKFESVFDDAGIEYDQKPATGIFKFLKEKAENEEIKFGAAPYMLYREAVRLVEKHKNQIEKDQGALYTILDGIDDIIISEGKEPWRGALGEEKILPIIKLLEANKIITCKDGKPVHGRDKYELPVVVLSPEQRAKDVENLATYEQLKSIEEKIEIISSTPYLLKALEKDGLRFGNTIIKKDVVKLLNTKFDLGGAVKFHTADAAQLVTAGLQKIIDETPLPDHEKIWNECLKLLKEQVVDNEDRRDAFEKYEETLSELYMSVRDEYDNLTDEDSENAFKANAQNLLMQIQAFIAKPVPKAFDYAREYRALIDRFKEEGGKRFTLFEKKENYQDPSLVGIDASGDRVKTNSDLRDLYNAAVKFSEEKMPAAPDYRAEHAVLLKALEDYPKALKKLEGDSHYIRLYKDYLKADEDSPEEAKILKQLYNHVKPIVADALRPPLKSAFWGAVKFWGKGDKFDFGAEVAKYEALIKADKTGHKQDLYDNSQFIIDALAKIEDIKKSGVAEPEKKKQVEQEHQVIVGILKTIALKGISVEKPQPEPEAEPQEPAPTAP